MTYQCNDCSLRRKGHFPNGKCPACGSFNISSDQQKTTTVQDPKTRKLRLMILVAVWSSLLVLLYQKLNA
ncbi:MAG: putative ATP-dependent serine protease [Oceanicoccus sp.]|jgi:predicted ATP-dependent serine protease